MRIYLDTNVFDFVAACKELTAAKKLVKDRNLLVLASEFHLQEIYAIPSKQECKCQLKVLTSLAASYTERPLAWHHAREVRLEAARCRPDWMKGQAVEGSVKKHLRNHKELWSGAKMGIAPTTESYRAFHKDSQSGIRGSTRFQKSVRILQTGKRTPRSLVSQWNDEGKTKGASLDDPENFWRHDAADSWYNAVVSRSPASRDYADFLLPYTSANAFADDTYYKFWMSDVDADNMPRNRVTGLASYFQLQRKVTHGNPFDALHANFMLEVDLFVTADKAFYEVLTKLRQQFNGDCAIPALLIRAEASAVDQLEAVTSGASTK